MKKLFLFLIILGGNSIKAQINLNAGLEVCLPMNGNANDYSGNGNHGVVVGATLTTDRFSNANSAYSFNGSSDYIYLNASPSIGNVETNNELSVTVWCKVNAWYQNWNVFPIVNKYNTASDWGWDYTLQSPKGCPEQLFVPNGPLMTSTICLLQTPGTTTFGQWDFYALTYSQAANQYNAYKNGVLIFTSPVSSLPIEATGMDKVYIGFSPASPAADEYADGSMDDLRLYSRALNPAEVSAIYAGATCGQGQDPLGINNNLFSDPGISLFPNPAVNKLFIKGDKISPDIKVTLTDLLGNEMTIETISHPGKNELELNIPGLANGFYLVRLKTGESTYTKKFLKIN